MNDSIKDIAKQLKGAFPFAIVNANPKNKLSELLTYKTKAEAQADGYDNIIESNSVTTPSDTPILPSVVNTVLNGYKVIIADLDNEDHIWNYSKFIRQARDTSWYNELGPPPIHGMFVISNDQKNVYWIDRDSANLDIYMTFNGDPNNMLRVQPSTDKITDIYFLDGRLYITAAPAYAMFYIDFLYDTGRLYSNGGSYQFSESKIENRNNGTNYIYNYQGGGTVSNGNYSVVAYRKTGTIDEFGRNFHYWAVSTNLSGAVAGPITLHNPTDILGDGNMYDYGRLGSTPDAWPTKLSLSKKSGLISHTTHLGIGTYLIVENITSINADDYTGISYYRFPNNVTAGTLTNYPIYWPIITSMGLYSSDESNYLLLGTSEGLLIDRFEESLLANAGTWSSTYITSSFNSPLMPADKADHRVGTWVLNNLENQDDFTDHYRTYSASKSLTIHSTQNFTGVSPLGLPCAYFDGISSLYRTGESNFDFGTNPISVSFYFRTNGTTIPATSAKQLVSFVSADKNDRLQFWLDSVDAGATSGKLSMYATTDGQATYDSIVGGVVLYDDKWHHVHGGRDGSNWVLYVDGTLLGTNPITNATTIAASEMYIGNWYSGFTQYGFDGYVSNVNVNQNVYTEKSITNAYNRMVLSLESGIRQTISSNIIDSIEVDENSGKALVCAGNVAHLMDIATGVILEKRSISVGKLNYASMALNKDNDTYNYVLVGDQSIETYSSTDLEEEYVYIESVIVGGGGGGGTGAWDSSGDAGGGGGGGGFYESSLSLPKNKKLKIKVGIGGTGAPDSGSPASATNGEESILDSIICAGGGAGGSGTSQISLNDGASGGCGGGGGYNNTGPIYHTGGDGIVKSDSNKSAITYGYNGGPAISSGGIVSGGGGGGAGQPGNTNGNGYGGDGITSKITGLIYGGGGGSCNSNIGTQSQPLGGSGGGGAGACRAIDEATAGTDGLGGGGGGSGQYGKDGGDGVIIIKILDTNTATFSSGCTVSGGTPSGGYKTYTVTDTSSDNETVTFS